MSTHDTIQNGQFRQNKYGQTIGEPMPINWSTPTRPDHITLDGHTSRVEPLNSSNHCDDLWEALSLDTTGEGWTYLRYGPFTSKSELSDWLSDIEKSEDPQFYVFIDKSRGKAIGLGSYLRIDPQNGSIEVGHIHMSPLLQRTTLATEVMYLMMNNVFDLGYRRYEWKCDSLNGPSSKAAQRLGFTFEGVFRQAAHYKGRNRDTAWYSILDKEWPKVGAALEAWLDPSNFDHKGQQKRSLDQIRGTLA